MNLTISARRLMAFSAMALLSALVFSCAGTGAGGAPKPTALMANNAGPGTDLATLERGYALYQSKCVRCHTDKVPKAPPLGQPWHDSSVMGAEGLYQSLTDVERYQVLTYVKGVERRRYSMKVGLKHSELDSGE